MSAAVTRTDLDDQVSAERVLRIAQIDGPIALHPLNGGRNNRAMRLSTPAGDFFYKRYAENTADRRDRLRSETAFYRYAHDIALSSVPTLLAADRETRSTLLTYVTGTKVASEDIDDGAIAQAAAFIVALNRERERGSDIPDASEAGFSLADHFQSIEDRMLDLSAHATHRKAAAFLRNELQPTLKALKPNLRDTSPLKSTEKCISPSDFGFHNAIRKPDGAYSFIDFEYAGWDDPARMICDFFLQVDVPVPARFLPAMVDACAPLFGSRDWLIERIQFLMPLYQLKWCCLLLSDLHPGTRHRREFAGVEVDGDHIDRQLARSQARYRDSAPIIAAQALAKEAT